MTKAEWFAEGEKRFGPDYLNWKFVCPICGNVAKVSDYKDAGAKDPNSAYEQCIGRFLPKSDSFRAFPSGNEKRGKPCDYAVYGLFRIPGVIVIDEGKELLAFDFAEAS